MSQNKNIVIQKADKKNTMVILDKISYISVIEEVLNDHTKSFNLDLPTGKEINCVTNLEKRITSDLKLLKYEENIDKIIHPNTATISLITSEWHNEHNKESYFRKQFLQYPVPTLGIYHDKRFWYFTLSKLFFGR